MTETAKINVDDSVLVERCQRGDFDAIERLITKYQNRIYNVILRICANPDDAADLTQDTFVKVLENINGFKGKSSFYTWAFRIAVNLTLNYHKRAANKGVTSIDSEDYGGGEHAKRALKEFLTDENSPDPEMAAQNKELCDLAMKALMKLDDVQRTVVVLRDIEDMSYADIAQVLDTELGTVKSRLNRARGRLREIMEAFLQ